MADGSTDERSLSIGVVADRAGMAVSAVRFYADRGLVQAQRGPNGRRSFRPDVLRRLGFIHAAQVVGLSLDQIAEALATLPADHAPTPEEWAHLSADWRPMLDERIRLLESLRDRLDDCIGCGCLSLEACNLRNPGDELAALGTGPRRLIAGSGPGEVPA